MNELEQACAQLEIAPEQVINWRSDDETLIVLADYGIGGIKKHRLPRLWMLPPEPARLNATDSALKLLTEHSIDGTRITGTGKDGRITSADVKRFMEGNQL